MASRLNTRFLLIFGVVVLLVVGAVGVLGVLALRAGTERHLEAGHLAMQEGDYETAMGAFARAVAKDKTNPEYLDLLESAMVKLRPDSSTIATQRYGQWIGLLKLRASQDTANPEMHLRLINALETEARAIDHPTLWAPVQDAADAMYEQVPADDPRRAHALGYRGIAMSRRLDVASPSEIDAAVEDLEKLVGDPPDDAALLDRAWAAIARIHRTAALDELRRGRERQAQERLDQAAETLSRAEEAGTVGPYFAIAAVDQLLANRDFEESSVTDAAIRAASDKMLAAAETSEDRQAILDAIGALDRIAGWSRMLEGTDMLERHVNAHPEDLFHNQVLALLKYRGGHYDEAEPLARAVYESEPLAIGMLSRYQHEIRSRGAHTLFQIALSRWDLAEEADRAALLETARAAQRDLADLISDAAFDPRIPLTEGRLALAEDDYATAAREFETVIGKTPDPSVEVLYHSAVALEGINEIGLALQRIDQAVEKQPDDTSMGVLQAQLQYRNGRLEEAIETVDALLASDPDDEAVQLLARQLAQQLAVESPDLLADPVKAVLAEADEQYRSDDFDSARATLVQGRRRSGRRRATSPSDGRTRGHRRRHRPRYEGARACTRAAPGGSTTAPVQGVARERRPGRCADRLDPRTL